MSLGVGRDSSGLDVFPCTLTRFDAQTGFQTYEIGYDCPGWARVGDDYVVVRLIGQGDTPRLSYINGTTGEVRDIAIDANLQAVISTSTTFAAVLMQNNIDNPYIAVYSLVSGEVVYRTGMAQFLTYAGIPTAQEIVWARSQSWSPPFIWITEDMLLISVPPQRFEIASGGYCCLSYDLPSSLRLLRLYENSADAQVVYRISLDNNREEPQMSPNYRYIIVPANGVQIVDMVEGQITDLLYSSYRQLTQYEWTFEWRDNRTLEVNHQVSPEEGCPSLHICTVRYTVDLSLDE